MSKSPKRSMVTRVYDPRTVLILPSFAGQKKTLSDGKIQVWMTEKQAAFADALIDGLLYGESNEFNPTYAGAETKS